MFRRKKKNQPPDSIAAKVVSGKMSVEHAQKLLSVRELETALSDKEHGARDHGNLVDLRKTWGRVILGILITTIVGDFILVGMVGSDTWQFTGNAWFLNVVATEHLVQIFGLVLIVLNSLFPKEKS
jgi:hypothetical protein